ncbi:MAG: hypothetical protein K0V04_23440 [Deltaproteobacteria bacterium]|nr:hypothetical protein [Deltaproteobacteria bacterium]
MSARLICPLLVSLLVTTASGCYSDVDGYVVARARHGCKRLERCNRSVYDELHDGDRAKCREDSEDALFAVADGLALTSWEYEPDAGRACIKAYRSNRRDCSADADAEIARECADVLSDGF